MLPSLRAQVLDREGLSIRLADVTRADLSPFTIDQLSRSRIPPRGGIIATWQTESFDPYPEALIVRDEDYRDTLAWLSSFFNGLTPITQWCRLWTQTSIGRLADHRPTPSVGLSLGPWIGAIIAELGAQAQYQLTLKETPGTVALTTASFAAARAVAVWGDRTDLREIATRHDDLAGRLREGGGRRLVASQLLPIWYAIAGDRSWAGADAERRALEPFSLLLERIARRVAKGDEAVADAVAEATDHFDLPTLTDCSRGPQLERVQALDRVAQQLASGPRSPAVDALLGFAASLVEPGAAVLPELLRRYVQQMPTSAIWLGAFAGSWSAAKVLADNQGLGRMISKAILADLDVEGRPICDIAYDELVRWLGGSSSKLPLRGMASRSVNVELVAGVTCPFATGRLESARPEQSPQSNTIPAPAASGERTRGAPVENLAQISSIVAELMLRMERLEARVGVQGTPAEISRAQSQLSLLGNLFGTGDGGNKKTSKGTRTRR